MRVGQGGTRGIFIGDGEMGLGWAGESICGVCTGEWGLVMARDPLTNGDAGDVRKWRRCVRMAV